jgi:membrane-bound metal-dependent hydrolase YbcI (DUF457 family)
MFLPHFGLGLAAKRLTPETSLGTLFLATQWADLVFFPLALAGLEHFRVAPGATVVTPMDFYDYPWSHSLVALTVWGLFVGGVYYLMRRKRAGAFLLAAGVVSHWLLDVIVHRRDMPVGFAGPYMGLRLWDSRPWTLLVEVVGFGLGIVVYLRSTTPTDRAGVWSFWALIAFLTAVWLASVLGPLPADERIVEYTGVAMWLFVPWGWWIDRHRVSYPREKRRPARPDPIVSPS